MADTLKGFFSEALVKRLAGDVKRVYPAFADRAFIRQAASGLEELELLDRGRHIARALADHLPESYAEAVEVLLRSLGPEHQSDELLGAGLEPFFYYPHTQFVAERGLQDFDLSMRAQYELTKRFSAEGSIRPYIAPDPERTFTFLRAWATDPNPHVRRLVSEGTRLRLPWAITGVAADTQAPTVPGGLRATDGQGRAAPRAMVAWPQNGTSDSGEK
jgi:3-methyladenine DNA glycosylase AlkC